MSRHSEDRDVLNEVQGRQLVELSHLVPTGTAQVDEFLITVLLLVAGYGWVPFSSTQPVPSQNHAWAPIACTTTLGCLGTMWLGYPGALPRRSPL